MRTKLIQTMTVLIILALISSLPSWAGNDNRKGTAGAMELLIPVGARSCAMSGALSASIDGTEAIFWNPAGVCNIQGVEAMFSNMSFIADIGVNYFAIASNFGGTGTFAVSVKTIDFGDNKVTTTDQPEGTGGTFSPSYITFGLTYSNKFTDRIYGGATLKYVSEKIVRTSASGIAIDFGIQYRSNSGLKLGVSLKNLGPSMQFDGPDLEFFSTLTGQDAGSRTRALRLSAAGFELPSVLDIGLGYDFQLGEKSAFTLAGSFQNSNFGSDEFRLGVEYGWNKLIFFRAGLMRQQQQADNIYGPTFGFGVNIPVGDNSSVILDYGYRKVDYFDGNQWLGIKLTM
jgi:hypothetical protein